MPYYPDSNPYYGSSQPPPYYTSSSSYSPATSRISSPYSFSYMSPISAMLSASIGTNPLPRGLRSYSPMLSAISETSSSPLIPRRDISGHRNSPRRLPKTYFRQPRPVTIDTDNIDLTNRKNSDNDEESTPGTISRGRTTVRMHTKKLKENPLLKKKKTQAELLMEKYLIKDKPTLREEDVPKRKRIWEEREEEVRNEPVRSGTIKRTNTIVKKNITQLAQPNDEKITDVSSQRKMSTELLKAEAALFDCMIQEELGINNQKEMDIEGENYEKAVDNASLKRNSKREQIPYVRIKSSHSVILDENGLPIEKRKSRALKKKSSKVLSLDELNNSSDCPDNNNSSEEITVKPKRRSTKKKKPIMFKIDTLHVEEKSSPKLLKKFNYEVIVEECNKVHDKSPSQSENMFNNMVHKDIPEYSNQEVPDVEYSKKADKSVDSPNNDENTRLSSINCDNECDIIAGNVAKLEREANSKQFEIINQPTSNDMNAQNNVSSKKEGTNALNKTDNGAKKIVKGCLQRQKATESNSQDQSSLPPLDDLVKEKTDNLTNEYSESKHKPKGSCTDKSVLSSKLNEVTKHKLLDNEGNLNLDTNSTKFDHSKSPLDMKNSHVDSKIPNAIGVNSSETETNVSLNRDKDRSIPLKTNNKTNNPSQDIVLGNNTTVFSLNNKQLAEKIPKDKPNLSLSNKDNTPEKGRQLLVKIAPKSAPTTPVLTKKVSSFESANISKDNKVLPEIKQITEAAKTLPSSVEEKKEINPLITEVKSSEQTILLQNKGKVSEFDKKFSNNAFPKSAPTTPILSKRTAQSPISNTKSTKCSSIVQCSATTVNKGTNNENDLLGSIEKGNVNKNSAQIAQNNKTSSLQTSEIALSKSIVSAQKNKEICEQDNTGSKRLVDDSSTIKKINQTVVCEGGFKSKKTDPVKTSDPSKSTANGSDLINQGNTTGLVKSVPEKNPPKDDCLNESSKNKEKVNLQQSHTNINRLEIATVSQIVSNNEPTQLPNVKNAIKTNVSNANLNKNLSNPDKNKFKLLKNETLINAATSAPLSTIDSESSQIYHQQDKTRPLGLQNTDYKGKDLEKLSKNNKGQINLKSNTSPEKPDNTNLISGKKELNKLVQKADKKGEETKMESHLKVDPSIVSDCAKTKNNFQTLNETAQKIAPKKPGIPSQIENKPSVGFDNISTNKLNFIKTAGSEIATSEKPKSPIMDGNKKLLGKIGKIDKINEISLEKKAVLSKPDEKLDNATTSSAKHLKSDLNKEVLEKDELIVLKKGVGNQKQSKSAVSDKSCGNTSQSEILAHPKSLEFKESKENKLEMSQSKCNQNILKPIKSELSDISKQLNQNLLVSSNENTQVKSAFEQLGKKCTKPDKGAQQLNTATNETVDLKEGSKKKRIKSESDVPENQDNDLNQNPLEINIMKNEDEKKSKSLKETETKKSSSKKKKSKDKNSSKEKKDSKSPKKLKDTLKSQEKLDKLNKKVSAVESQVQEQTESSSRRDIDKEKSEILDISTVELSKRSTRLMHFINKCVKLSSDNESLSVEISDEDLSTSSSSEFSTDSECTSDSEESSTDDSGMLFYFQYLQINAFLINLKM